MKKITRIFIYIVLLLTLTAGVIYFFVRNINTRNKKLIEDSRYLIIGKNNVIAVYEDRLALKIPYEIEIDKNEKIGDIVDKGEYDRVLENINRILPEQIERYKVIKLGMVDLKVKNAINIPETIIDEKRYIIQSSVDSLFKDYYKKLDDISFNNVTVEILNGNGRTGYAKRVGDALKNKFALNYIAATHSDVIGATEIIINNLPKKKVEEIVLELNENYIKITDAPAAPNAANLVIILGDDKTSKVEIELTGKKERVKEIEEKLKDKKYGKIIKKELGSDEIQGNDQIEAIEYSRENYYTAYKLGNLLGIKNIIENNSREGTIQIRLK